MENKILPGKLYICPTPIGNLSDITLRTLEVLRGVDLIACEDTRDSSKLLKHYDIHSPLTSYHDHNRKSKGNYLIDQLLSGKSLALISDAGMPSISDPGLDIVRLCIENNIEYTVLPGPSAGICALVLSGLSSERFCFEGFLPRNGRERKERLSDISTSKYTTILYESPHHLLTTLSDLAYILGERKIAIIREISKIYEEKLLFININEAIEHFTTTAPRGEFVLVIEALSKEQASLNKAMEFKDIPISEHVQLYMNQGYEKKDAMKMAAKDLGISKRDVYKMLNDIM